MKKLVISIGIALAMFIFAGCKDDVINLDDYIVENPTNGTDILMLIVDYTTNKFEGGKEMHFNKTSPTFTITHEYKSPGDFGWMKLYHSEIDELIFYGDIIWLGCGNIIFPTDILKAEDFAGVAMLDIRYPKSFASIFPVDTMWKDYYPNSTIEMAWISIQKLVKTREYLEADSDIEAKVYEYQPSVGWGDIADRKWIFFLKKNSINNTSK